MTLVLRAARPELTEIPELARALSERGLTLAVGESCTGGLIAAACTDLPGSSAWFLGGAVAYANSAKQRLLGVPGALIEKNGAVSLPVARAMTLGVHETLDADCSITVTGVAGPDGGSAEKPVGTVCFGWGFAGIKPELAARAMPELPYGGAASREQKLLGPLLGGEEYHLEFVPGNPGACCGQPAARSLLVVTQRMFFAGRPPDVAEDAAENGAARRAEIRALAVRHAAASLLELVRQLY